MCARHGQLLGGVSPLQTWQQELLVKGKGVRREAESEGSRIRLIKDHCSYPAGGFATIEDVREWFSQFANWYNNEHHHSGINFLTPAQRRSPFWKEHLAKRRKVYEKAKERHPERWNGRETRDWTLPEKVWLNPEKDSYEESITGALECLA